MTDGAPQNPPGNPPPGDGGNPPSASQRPDWLPEDHWDATAGGMKAEFGAHYQELANFHKTQTEAQAALAARKPEDIKFEVKLPETVKVPDGFEVKIDQNDPRIPVLRDMAVKHGWTQETVDALVALDAQQKIEAHTAEMARVAEEDKKLGDNGTVRKQAVNAWLNGLRDRKEITEDEYTELRTTAAFAAGVTVLEKLIAKSNGSVPGGGGNPPPPKPADLPMEQRWYGAQQQKAS